MRVSHKRSIIEYATTTMQRSKPHVYLNGQFVPRSEARCDIEDRGMLFADGVYEVVRYYAGRPLAMQEHLDRLRHSLDQILLPPPPQLKDFNEISDELVKINQFTDAKLYWQITRGSAPRHHLFPTPTQPTVLAIAYPAPPLDPHSPPPAITAILTKDLRWHLCSIKSLMLLPNVMAKNKAHQAGAEEAILHRDGRVTETASASVFIVQQGRLWTHPADQWILGGITRQMVLDQAHKLKIPTIERTYTTGQLLDADEVMTCGTSTPLAGVVRVDNQPIGDGGVGKITQKLHAALTKHIADTCGG